MQGPPPHHLHRAVRCPPRLDQAGEVFGVMQSCARCNSHSTRNLFEGAKKSHDGGLIERLSGRPA